MLWHSQTIKVAAKILQLQPGLHSRGPIPNPEHLKQSTAKVLKAHHKSFLCFCCEQVGTEYQSFGPALYYLFFSTGGTYCFYDYSLYLYSTEKQLLWGYWKVTVENAGNQPKWAEQYFFSFFVFCFVCVCVCVWWGGGIYTISRKMNNPEFMNKGLNEFLPLTVSSAFHLFHNIFLLSFLLGCLT